MVHIHIPFRFHIFVALRLVICKTIHKYIPTIAATMMQISLSMNQFYYPFPLSFTSFAPTVQFKQRSSFEEKKFNNEKSDANPNTSIIIHSLRPKSHR